MTFSDRSRRDAEQLAGLHLREPPHAHQVEGLTLVIRACLHGPEHTRDRPAVSPEPLVAGDGTSSSRRSTAAGCPSKRRATSLSSQRMCWLAIAKSCALSGGLAQRLEQPFRHGAQQFVGLQVERRLRQVRIAPVQHERRTADAVVGPPGRAGPGRSAPRANPRPTRRGSAGSRRWCVLRSSLGCRSKHRCSHADSPSAGCALATLSMNDRESRMRRRPRRPRVSAPYRRGRPPFRQDSAGRGAVGIRLAAAHPRVERFWAATVSHYAKTFDE